MERLPMSHFARKGVHEIDYKKGISMDAIYNVANIIAEKFNPEKIILFGSHAYGDPKP
ncbi:MAG: hypothetical protein ONB46_24670 [candidate division KSB1 bacterium]|nr:hypothetical protein [candidate division KSB1 bacterium]MDZ7369078.1 hypothetical protein [candidate division KSB1 bacterium]MDZ7407083.1 hypothetical protein [candidate division KSB1 bacterium]